MGHYSEDFHTEQISHKKANAEVDEELRRLIASYKTRIKLSFAAERGITPSTGSLK